MTVRSARGPRRLRVALVVLLLFVAFTVATARLFVWPSLPPLPQRADAIIELGGPGDRDAVAIALAEQHMAPVLIQSTLASDATSDTCLPPFPEVAIECFDADPPTKGGGPLHRRSCRGIAMGVGDHRDNP